MGEEMQVRLRTLVYELHQLCPEINALSCVLSKCEVVPVLNKVSYHEEVFGSRVELHSFLTSILVEDER